MQQKRRGSNISTGIWLLIIVCVIVVMFTLACGAAYTGISKAQTAAVKASLGHIESTLYLAETKAQMEELVVPAGSYKDLLKSYSESEAVALPAYERYVLETMLDIFGPDRDFDFAIERYQDSDEMKTTIYFFPEKGKTNIDKDRHYIMSNGQLIG